MSKSSPQTTLTTASRLSGEDIGLVIRFRTYNEQRQISIVVTAELRLVSHDASMASLTVGRGAEQEYGLDPDHQVVLNPMPDYSEVYGLLGVDPRSLEA